MVAKSNFNVKNRKPNYFLEAHFTILFKNTYVPKNVISKDTMFMLIFMGLLTLLWGTQLNLVLTGGPARSVNGAERR